MKLIEEIREAVKGIYSLAVGMKITGKYFLRPEVTVHYPRKTVDNIETFSGHVELAPGKKSPGGGPDCIVCGMCARNCPSNCLDVQIEEIIEENPDPEKKKKKTKKLSALIYEFSYCSLCGQCIENCPSDALQFSNHVYWAEFDRCNIKMDLLARYREQAGKSTGT